MISDVALWFAKDKNNKYVTIFDIDDRNKHNDFMCPVCSSKVIPKAIHDNAQVSAHFAHLDASKCTAESIIHWCYKNNFLIVGSKFKIYDRERDIYESYACKEIYIEKQHSKGNMIYRPDVTVITESDDMVFFEMNYKSKKKVENYINIWLEFNCPVIEIDIKQLLQLNSDGFSFMFNPIYYNHKCYKKPSIKKKCYDAILELKESTYRQNKNEKANMFVNKLDWLWSTIANYKISQEIDSVALYASLDYILDNSLYEDSMLLVDIINKFRCTKILEDYSDYRQNDFYNTILKLFDKNILTWYKISKNDFYITDNKIVTEPKVIIERKECRGFYTSESYTIFGNNVNQIVEEIHSFINSDFKGYFREYLYRLYKYDYPKLFECNEVYLSYNPYLFNGDKYKTLNRYDFVSVIEKLRASYTRSQEYISNIINTVEPNFNYPRKREIRVFSEEINNEIRKILYPVVYAVNHVDTDNVNLVLNSNYTMHCGKTQKWLVNDFINVLELFGYTNFINVKPHRGYGV